MKNNYLRLGASKTPEENSGTLEQFINRMDKLVDNRKQQGELLRELVESVRYNFIEYCEPDHQHNFKQRLEVLLRGIK